MPYCNQCGRYIGGGMLCEWCGDTREKPIDPQDKAGEDANNLFPVPDEMPPLEEDMQATLPPCEEDQAVELSNDSEEPLLYDITLDEELGNEQSPEQNTEQTSPQDKEAESPFQHAFEEVKSRFFKMEDKTDRFSNREIEEGKTMSLLAYLWVLWFVPYFFSGRSRYVKFHMSQALPWLLVDCLALSFAGIAILTTSFAPMIAPLFAAMAEVLLLLSIGMKGVGVVAVLRSRAILLR